MGNEVRQVILKTVADDPERVAKILRKKDDLLFKVAIGLSGLTLLAFIIGMFVGRYG